MDLVTRGVRPGAALAEDRVISLADPQARRHVEVVLRGDRLAGFACVGAPGVSSSLSTAFDRRTPLPVDPLTLLVPQTGLRDRSAAAAEEASPTLIPGDATICRCNGVSKNDLLAAWDEGCRSVADMTTKTRATTGCGGCRETVCGLVDWLTEVDGDPESSSQPVRNTRPLRVSGAKRQARSGETQRT